MAGSRIEKFSTIFKRYTGLIKTGAVLEESRPIWYDVYKTFPPSVEPLRLRSEPKIDIKEIYYPEDILRQRVFLTYGKSNTTYNAINPVQKQLGSNMTEHFIEKYLSLANNKGLKSIDLNDERIFKETEEALKQEGYRIRRKTEHEPGDYGGH